MLISDYLRLRGTVGTDVRQDNQQTGNASTPADSAFAAELKNLIAVQNGFTPTGSAAVPTTAEQLEIISGINFSRHAVERINQRNIDVFSADKLERLSKGVELAEQKGSDAALVIVDRTAFIVSVRSNKVITAVNAEDMQGNVFTNIDSTVIM